MAVVSFVLVLVAVLVVLAFAIAAIARLWVVRTEPLTLRGIDVARARDVVAMYVENVHDTRFGFPTGVFRVDERRSSPTRLVAQEVNFGAGMGFRIVRFGIMIPVALIAAAARMGCLATYFAFVAGVLITAFVIGPIFAIAVVEVVLRWLMRSAVTADLEPLAGEADACSVRFTLRGLSAFGVRRQLLRGLAKPVLPLAHGGSALANAPEPWTRDRLNVVYASGGGIALVAAALIVALSPGLRGESPSSYTTGGYVESSADSYDDTYDDSYDDTYDDSYDDAYEDESVDESSDDTYDDTYDNSYDDEYDESYGEEPSDAGGDARAASGLAARAADGGAFTVHAPRGFAPDRRRSDQGAYVESRWRERDDPDVTFLVDYTPGFAGTPREGAQDVRRLVRRLDDYREIEFSATDVGGRPAWRWEFEADGLHKVDTFLVECGIGYAVLGAAPIERWTDYAEVFEAATQSLTPSCETPPEPDDPTGSSSGDELGPRASKVLRRHFELLDRGEYERAFALMSPRYRRQSPRWPIARAAADPGITMVTLAPAEVAGREAWVEVDFYARDRTDVRGSDTRCRRFRGTAHLLRVGGAWRYDPQGNDLAARELRRSNPNCP